MSKPTDSLATLEELAPRGRTTQASAPITFLRRDAAGNDAEASDAAISGNEAEAWARHALAANGFGDAGSAGTADSDLPSSHELQRDARARQARVLGEVIATVTRGIVAIVREAKARYLQHRRAAETIRALSRLDDRSLRDLGFSRDELESIGAETSGIAEVTRMRVHLQG